MAFKTKTKRESLTLALAWLAMITITWKPITGMIIALTTPCIQFFNQPGFQQALSLRTLLGTV